MLFETHSHLNFPQFADDLPEVVKRAGEAGVSEILVVGTDWEGTRRAIQLAHQYKLSASVGVHPSDAESAPGELSGLKRLARDERVVAVGETGLDFACPADREKQAVLFRALLGLAADLGLPVIIHSRGAAVETLEILRESGPVKGVWHCFSGDESLARKVLDLGLFISFTANITYPKNAGLRSVVRAVPLNRMLLETDCPFLPPEGKRGRRNEPAWLPVLAGAIAAIKEVGLEEVAETTFNNSRDLFLKQREPTGSHCL